MAKASGQSWGARLLQGISLAGLATLGYQLGQPAPPVAAEVRGVDLVVRVPGLAAAPEATVGEAHQGFQRAPTPGEWILRGVLVGTPQEVVVQAAGGSIHLGELQAEPPPVRILGPAPGHQLEVHVGRGVTVWWDGAPEVRLHLPPGLHRIPAPPRGDDTWEMGYRSAHESGEAHFDARKLLQAWATEAARVPDAGTHLAQTGLLAPSARALLADPSPRDRFAGWAEELMRATRDPLEVRLLFNRQSDLLALAGHLQGPLPCDPDGIHTGRFPARPELREARQLEPNGADGGYSDLMNDMVITRVVQPPGRRIRLQEFEWPGSPPGRGPLVVAFHMRHGEELWVRLWEVRMGGNGYRVHFPPRHCDGPEREWVVWEIPAGDSPEPGNLFQLELWNPDSTGVPPGLELGEITIGRRGEAPAG